jgi:hypothetical protein
MKELLTRLFWIVITVTISLWVAYNSWAFFFNYKSPFAVGATGVRVETSQEMKPYKTRLQPAEKVQETASPQRTAPGSTLFDKPAFNGQCNQEELNSLKEQVIVKPALAQSEIATRITELELACK